MYVYIYITCIYSEHHGSFIKFVFRTIWYALKCDFRLARTMACFCHPRGVTAGITCMTESSDHSMVHFKNWHELNKLKLLPVHHQGDQWAACQCPCCCLPMVGTTKHVLICFPFVTMCFSVFNFCLMCSISFVFTNSQTELCNCYHVATVAPATNFGCPDLGHRMPCLHGKPSTFPVSSNHTRSPLWERPGRHRQGKHRPIIRTGKKKCLNCKPAVNTWLFATPAHKVQRSNLRYCSMPKKLGFPSWAEIYRNNASQTNQMPDACASEEFGNRCCDEISWTCDNIHQHWNKHRNKHTNVITYQHTNIQTFKHWNIETFSILAFQELQSLSSDGQCIIQQYHFDENCIWGGQQAYAGVDCNELQYNGWVPFAHGTMGIVASSIPIIFPQQFEGNCQNNKLFLFNYISSRPECKRIGFVYCTVLLFLFQTEHGVCVCVCTWISWNVCLFCMFVHVFHPCTKTFQ